MIDTRNLSIVEPTANYQSILAENTTVKNEKSVLVGCLVVLSVALVYVCYKEYQRRQIED